MRKILLSLCLVAFLFSSLTVYATQTASVKGIAVVEAENLNVRSGSSKEYDILGVLSKDTSVDVKGYVDPDWYIIEYEGKEGYINSKYVVFTPQDEIEGGFELVSKKYYVMILVIAILLLSGAIVYTIVNIKKEKEQIPITDHDDTNMHMGEISYDTYRLDIDPQYFEQTSVIPQPESIYDENKKVSCETETNISGQSVKTDVSSDLDAQSFDLKLEQASAQIAALQKEVEQLKKQKTDSI